MPLETWRENLKAIRKKTGYSQSSIALQLDRSQQTVANWEAGKADPSIDDLLKITNIFGVSIADIFGIVHLSGESMEGENDQKSTPNSTPISTPNDLKNETAYLENLIKNLHEVVRAKDQVIISQEIALAAQKSLIDSVNQQLAKAVEENERLKRAVPELPTDMASHSVKKTAG